MLGELHPVWSRTWREIWVPLSRHRDAPADIWITLYTAFVRQPRSPGEPPLPTEFDADGHPTNADELATIAAYENALGEYRVALADYEEISTGAKLARPVLRLLCDANSDESWCRATLRRAFEALAEYQTESLSNRYFNLADQFLSRYNVRYDLRRPFSLQPTPPGVYTKLFEEIVLLCQQDASLSALLRDYREAFQDLGQGVTSGRINTCLQKQVNLLEGITSLSDGVSEKTLGKMCNEVKTWPSTAVSEAAKAMYGFASDHTGLRHGTIKKAKEGKTPTVHRDMEIRDLVAVSAFFTGMAAYLSDKIDAQQAYGL